MVNKLGNSEWPSANTEPGLARTCTRFTRAPTAHSLLGTGVSRVEKPVLRGRSCSPLMASGELQPGGDDPFGNDFNSTKRKPKAPKGGIKEKDRESAARRQGPSHYTHSARSWHPNASGVSDARFLRRFAIVYLHVPCHSMFLASSNLT